MPDQTQDQFAAFSADDALEVFRERPDPGRPLTANDIIEALGWSRRTVHNKLDELEDKGELEKRAVGSRAVVWWIPLADATPRTGNESPMSSSTPDSPDSSSALIPSTVEEVLEAVRDHLPARTEEDRIERSEAILTAYEFLQTAGSGEIGEADIDEIKSHTFEKHPIDRDAQRQWDNYLREGLVALPGVEPASGTSSVWYFIHPESSLAKQLDDTELDEDIAKLPVKEEGKAADRQRALAQIAYDYLEERGSASKDDFQRILPDYFAHYTSFEILWGKFLRDALKTLDDVAPPPRGTGQWKYLSDEVKEELDIEIDDWIKELDGLAKGQGASAERQQQLVQLAYNYLRDEGPATRSDFEDNLPDFTAHYEGFEGLWTYVLRPTFNDAEYVKRDGTRNRATLYRYNGPDASGSGEN